MSKSDEGVREIAKEIVTKEEPTNIGELLKANGLGVFHVRPKNDDTFETLTGIPARRAMTIVYKQPHRNARVLEIATAVLHPLDDYTKKVGAKLAIDNFLAGKTVLIPRTYRKAPPAITLRNFFSN